MWDLTNIMGHLNTLNLRLQGKDCLFPTLFDFVTSFMTKLSLFSNDFGQKCLSQFIRMQENPPNYDKCTKLVSKLHDSFKTKFADFLKDKANTELYINPFSIGVEDLNCYPPEMQTEIIYLQHHNALKSKYKEIISTPTSQDYVGFWKFLPVLDFPNLHDFALRYSCRFGSTYVCEQSFSVMNMIKTKYRSKLTDSHLKHLILLASSKVDPNIDDILSNMQVQKPH